MGRRNLADRVFPKSTGFILNVQTFGKGRTVDRLSVTVKVSQRRRLTCVTTCDILLTTPDFLPMPGLLFSCSLFTGLVG